MNGINLTVWLDEQERIRQFDLSGHAGFSVEGQDIVCAAVSALSIAAANGLEHFLGTNPVQDASDGYLSLSLSEIGEAE
ncbi:MAG: ribosomal-processing cysteine protease Prp, partial [Desulfitobacterium hafniense]|nr:ribosomal-processing cysteine protease Prp [Desulfitobacterium hafniense]